MTNGWERLAEWKDVRGFHCKVGCGFFYTSGACLIWWCFRFFSPCFTSSTAGTKTNWKTKVCREVLQFQSNRLFCLGFVGKHVWSSIVQFRNTISFISFTDFGKGKTWTKGLARENGFREKLSPVPPGPSFIQRAVGSILVCFTRTAKNTKSRDTERMHWGGDGSRDNRRGRTCAQCPFSYGRFLGTLLA